MIPFNKPYLTGKETEYIAEAVKTGKISGNGMFTQKCQTFFETKFGFKKTLMTTSCTDALEMCAILLNLGPGDEVILPSYTFVSTANAFILRGVKLVFVDSNAKNPNIDELAIEPLITSKTKAIVVVHYAGIAVDMDPIMTLADKHKLYVVEDAAQAIDSYYKGRPLGSIGHLAAFSFHETKNIIAGEGGMLVVNSDEFVKRAEIIWEKGTNRAEFFRGEVNKYGWVDIGSSFLPSEIITAFLFAQLENLEKIQNKRKAIWQKYYDCLLSVCETNGWQMPYVPDFATNNGHMFYLVVKDIEQRTKLISYLKEHKVMCVFHYLSLHLSDFFIQQHDGRSLINTDHFSDTLVRLPLFYELTDEDQDKIIQYLKDF